MNMLAKVGYVGIFICIHSDISGGPSAGGHGLGSVTEKGRQAPQERRKRVEILQELLNLILSLIPV
jgi:hypothetical protein